VYDEGSQLADTIQRVADRYERDVNVIHGQGEFLESSAYQGVIAGYEKVHKPYGGHH
jgi:uncharacterized hydantoinase/oxoprolinase family protein